MKIDMIISKVEKLGYKFIDELDQDTLLFKSKRGIELEVWLDEKIIKKSGKDFEPRELTYKEVAIENYLKTI